MIDDTTELQREIIRVALAALSHEGKVAGESGTQVVVPMCQNRSDVLIQIGQEDSP